ncbi:MAG: flagella basal body P-ring formation protein FlgA [Candidatus Sulfotelmatobacter sp.]
MKRLAMALIGVGFAAAALLCRAQSACTAAVRPSIEVGPGELTLADLLEPNACPHLHQLAAQVSLGTAPRAGGERVLDGRQIGGLIDALADGLRPWPHGKDTDTDKDKDKDTDTNEDQRIPERIVVRRQGATKSCAEIAEFIAPGAAAQALDCAAARGIPEDSPLKLLKTEWNARLRRWEFALRCVRPEDCVPFLVWGREKGASTVLAEAAPPKPQAGASSTARLVKRGQTATLTWDQGGIRIVLPVTCLDAGGLGQFVRVRFPNAGQTLRAEVVGAGTLRANL